MDWSMSFCICPWRRSLMSSDFKAILFLTDLWSPRVMSGTNVPVCVSSRDPIAVACGKPVRDGGRFSGRVGLFQIRRVALISALSHPASEPRYGGGQTEPDPGLPGGPSPVPRPGPGREGASLGVARRAPKIGKKMGEPGGPEGEGRRVEGVWGGSDVLCPDPGVNVDPLWKHPEKWSAQSQRSRSFPLASQLS